MYTEGETWLISETTLSGGKSDVGKQIDLLAHSNVPTAVCKVRSCAVEYGDKMLLVVLLYQCLIQDLNKSSLDILINPSIPFEYTCTCYLCLYCLYICDRYESINNVIVTNIIIDELLLDFINFIYLLQNMPIWISYQKTIRKVLIK